jgi:hypothetical protein
MTHVAILTAFLLSIAAAQDVPPPPKPQDDGPSLEVTMKFLQEKLPSKVDYIIFSHDNLNGTDFTNKGSTDMRNVSASAGRCQIDFHLQETTNGHTDVDVDSYLSLKQVENIEVIAEEQHIKLAQAKLGHPEYSYKVDPPVFTLVATYSVGDGLRSSFYDESLANRVAKALQHAVELCGGGSKDPF